MSHLDNCNCWIWEDEYWTKVKVVADRAPNLEKIVEEATRRGIQQGKREAWEELQKESKRLQQEMKIKNAMIDDIECLHEEHLTLAKNKGLEAMDRFLLEKLTSLDNSSKEE